MRPGGLKQDAHIRPFCNASAKRTFVSFTHLTAVTQGSDRLRIPITTQRLTGRTILIGLIPRWRLLLRHTEFDTQLEISSVSPLGGLVCANFQLFNNPLGTIKVIKRVIQDRTKIFRADATNR